ncbi:MAG: hypothetical protein ACT452_05455 [Microthrixaceae bacterium]
MAAATARRGERGARGSRSEGRERRGRAASGSGRRYVVVHDIEGPRVRLGVLWFVIAAMAIGVGPLPTAVV